MTLNPQIAPNELLIALGIEQITNSEYNNETEILLLEIEDCDVLRGLAPDFEKLKKSTRFYKRCFDNIAI